MNFITLVILGIGLSMDAFAVSTCLGLGIKVSVKKALIIAGYFGIFHTIMPLIGYLFGMMFSHQIDLYDHYIAFLLLSFIGTKMLIEGIRKKDFCDISEVSLSPKKMLPLALATSIDVMAVGVSLALFSVNIVYAALVIGSITFAVSIIGVKVGALFGEKLKSKAGILGGIILIAMGIKILIEGL